MHWYSTVKEYSGKVPCNDMITIFCPRCIVVEWSPTCWIFSLSRMQNFLWNSADGLPAVWLFGHTIKCKTCLWHTYQLCWLSSLQTVVLCVKDTEHFYPHGNSWSHIVTHGDTAKRRDLMGFSKIYKCVKVNIHSY